MGSVVATLYTLLWLTIWMTVWSAWMDSSYTGVVRLWLRDSFERVSTTSVRDLDHSPQYPILITCHHLKCLADAL